MNFGFPFRVLPAWHRRAVYLRINTDHAARLQEIFLHSGVFSAEYDSEGDVDDVMGSVPDPELASLSDDGSIPGLETYYSGSDYE